ncbi:MAG: peptide chain release factor N(5)-glutamine methyltransferase [Candidatus Zixiibacteriota bacterium]
MPEQIPSRADATTVGKGIVARLITENAAILKRAGIDTPETEIEQILCYLLKVDRLNLFLHGDKLIDIKITSQMEKIVARRATRYPLQLILNEYWFYGRKFYVNDDVMVPAPETEILCQGALTYLNSNGTCAPKIADIGTGSGVIAITLACEFSASSILALDISKAALKVAQKNASAHNVAGKIEFRESDLMDGIKKSERFDLIISNPPYVTEEEYKTLSPEVHADPKISITSGEDGLDAIRVILKKAPDYLNPRGRIMFEIGHDQAERITRLTEKDKRYRSISVLKDLNNFDRIVILTCHD